jgi:hypothetical protein
MLGMVRNPQQLNLKGQDVFIIPSKMIMAEKE